MAKGSLKLNMKRDDARTLMLKMDARMTYAGRERHAGFKVEGERKLRHIQVTHRLVNSELSRAMKGVQRRFDFYQTLKAQNRERREKRGAALCEEEEAARERDRRAGAATAPRRRKLPRLAVRPDAVGSIRRDVKGEYTHKLAQETRLNRSLLALGDSYSKHKTPSELQAKLQQDLEPTDTAAEKLPTDVDGRGRLPDARYPKDGVPPLKARLSAIQLGGTGESSATREVSRGMPAGEVGDAAPNDARISRPVAGQPSSLGRSFYMKTGTDGERHEPGTGPLQTDLPVLPSIERTRRKGVHAREVTSPAGVKGPLARAGRPLPSSDQPTARPKKPRPVPSVSLGPQQVIPLRFYGPEANPFLRESGGPPGAVYRPRDLINADKDDEMYEWLGFESRQEFEKLQAADVLLGGDREEGSDTSDVVEDGT